jgi:hypothetical protein
VLIDMNESEQKQWIRDNPDYYGESSLGMWELVAELLGFNTEKAEEEIFIAEGVNSYEELSEASKCSFLDAMETDHKDYVEKRAPLIFKHIEGVDHGIAMQKNKQEILEEITLWAVSNFPEDVGEFLDLNDEQIQILKDWVASDEEEESKVYRFRGIGEFLDLIGIQE